VESDTRTRENFKFVLEPAPIQAVEFEEPLVRSPPRSKFQNDFNVVRDKYGEISLQKKITLRRQKFLQKATNESLRKQNSDTESTLRSSLNQRASILAEGLYSFAVEREPQGSLTQRFQSSAGKSLEQAVHSSLSPRIYDLKKKSPEQFFHHLVSSAQRKEAQPLV
jgi:hypothetical protein